MNMVFYASKCMNNRAKCLSFADDITVKSVFILMADLDFEFTLINSAELIVLLTIKF